MNRASNPRRAAICAALILALTLPGVNLRGDPAEVPVKEVVLFSSGVGYFQHEGKVQGDATSELHFKTAQINDILKSLVLQDLDGGRAGVVTYPSQDPLEKTLGSFQVDISDNPSLGDLLNKLRGARVSVSAGGENFPATILGVEKRTQPGGKEDAPVERSWVNFVTDKGIRSLALESITALKLEDAGLQEELNRALAAVAGARDQDKKPVDLRFDGQGERRVRVGYVVETPVWKASYRLIFGDGPGATLQGWAIIENQTDNDWKDVRLSLVSGRPISFVEDLYQPLYVPRPTVVPELYASLRPQVYDEGAKDIESAKAADEPTGGALRKMRSAVSAPASPMMADAMSAPAPAPMNPAESVAPLSTAGAVGELFQFTVPNVSLARQRSAMIPILNDPFDVQKVSVFNQAVLDKHPLNGARLKNNSPAKINLLQGPVTVYDDGRYAGDARLDDVSPGQERLLTYGVDLQTLVTVKDLASQQTVQSGRIVKGVLLVSRKSVSAREYAAENKADHERRLVIEHPVRAGWKLTDSPKPAETTEKVYRFEETIAPGKSEKLTVKEENVISQQVALLSSGPEEVLSYSRTGEISAAVRDALAKAAAMKQAAAETQRQIEDRDAQAQAITSEQSRIRENLKTVERTSAYATRLLKKLDDQESQLEKLRSEADDLRTKLNGQQAALAGYLNGLSVE